MSDMDNMEGIDDTPAIFISINGAIKARDLMYARGDIVAAVCTKRVRRGEITGYTLTCKDTDGLIFNMTNSMLERLYGRVA